MRKLHKVSILIIVLCIMVVIFQITVRNSTKQGVGDSQLITSVLVEAPVARGQYLFWQEAKNGTISIKMYNLSTGHTTLVASTAKRVTSLATDGQTLVWVEGDDTGDQIMRFDVASNQVSTLLTGDKNITQGLAIDNGILYYAWNDSTRSGLYSRNLKTNAEQLLSDAGRYPVAADGKVLWVEQTQSGCFPKIIDDREPAIKLCLWAWHLHLYNGADKVIASSTNEGPHAFSGYHVSGQRVVWSQTVSRKQMLNINDGARGES